MFIEHEKIDKVVFSTYTLAGSKGDLDPEANYCDTINGKAYSWTSPKNDDFILDEDDQDKDTDDKYLVGEITGQFIHRTNYDGSLNELLDAISRECEELSIFLMSMRI